MMSLTQRELDRLGACVVHDLDAGDDDAMLRDYEIACSAIEKIAAFFGLDARAALAVERRM